LKIIPGSHVRRNVAVIYAGRAQAYYHPRLHILRYSNHW
jgi:hypothetical protein